MNKPSSFRRRDLTPEQYLELVKEKGLRRARQNKLRRDLTERK